MCKKIVFLFIIFANCIYANAQEAIESGFVEYIESANNLQTRQPPVIRKNLGTETESEEGYLISRRGCFEVTYDDNYFMTEGVKHCLKLALDNWEDKISINKPVKFHVCISEGLPSEIAILTHVSYYKVRKYCLPTNLFKQNNTIKEETCDTIQINALIDWNSSWTYDDTYYGSVSLLSGFMRSIAHIMGFGTTLHNRQGGIGFAINRTPSTFDQMIYNGEKYLSDLYTTSNKSVFDSFFKKGTCLQSSSFDYNLYDTDHFEENMSGMYFSLGYDNILEYPLTDKSKTMCINHETLDVLEKIGWNILNHEKEISCDSTDVLGYGTIYTGQTFNLHGYSSTNSISARWRYQTYDINEKEYKTISSSTGTSFHVKPAIKDECLDEFNSLQARVVASVDGTDYYYPLTLETRPLIKEAHLSNFKSSSNERYQIDLTINHTGATGGAVLISDDTGAVREFGIWNGTQTIHNLLKGYNLYVDICLENQYGTAIKFIQDEPYLNSHIIKNRNSVNTTTKEINDVDNVIRDSDVVVFNIPDGLNDADSIAWYLIIGNDFENEKKKEIYLENIDERSYKFIVSAADIDCEFSKKYGKEYTECRFGESWGGGFKTFDGTCRFVCDVYDNGKLRNRYYSKNYVLDVLPAFPTIDVIKIWYSEELTCSIASIKVHHENAETTSLQVLPYYNSTIEYHETDFSKESDGLYDVELNIWGEDILYCFSCNDYGFCKGPWINVYTADIEAVEDSKLIVAIDCNKVKIHKDGECKIDICSLDGKICASSKFTNEYTTLLNKGVYIIRVRDLKSNRINVKSIIVK